MTAKHVAAFTLKLLTVVIVAPLAFCVALPIGLNEIQGAKWAEEYSKMPHPQGTDRIATRHGTVKESNGNHCDFIYLEARSYLSEDRSSIEAYYDQLDRLDPQLNRVHADFDNKSANYRTAGSSDVRQEFGVDLASVPDGTYYTLEGYGYLGEDWRCW